ncbi:KPN_02809 family neutral zinc metallopeptidase [Microtetraspora niveoalba]|uniref:KPN_02809 family neutral zinc metallopeptidase n=1 Tax=Microtetraspora niveoalba TaxID=46175 RepID=UPI000834A246|nr:neutral zinc metallopeptidase [Microtetraspora niveoalba]
MDFDDRAELDASQVDDVGSSGMSRGGGLAIGGGAAGILVIVLALVFGVDPTELLSDGPPAQSGRSARSGDLAAECKTGADADQSEKCRVVGVVNSLQKYWKGQVDGYRQAKTTLFTGGVQTGCGAADSSVGPFYCSADRRVYLDLGFFDELHSQFGAEGGPFAQAYVIAHEYGHHVQNLLGDIAKGTGKGATSGSVRLELQADCYAGVWAKNAVSTGFYAKPFSDTDIRQALDAASAVGDDRIQEKARGRVSPENFTHGTSAQRMKWFKRGYSTGDPQRCDTFSGGI